jgi:hypothetical protein
MYSAKSAVRGAGIYSGVFSFRVANNAASSLRSIA